MELMRRHKAVLMLAFVALLYYPRFIKRPDGMTLYPLAARCMLQGEALETCAPGFTYPPAFAFFMIPFAQLPMWLGNLLWYVVLVCATCLSFRLCEHLALKTLPGRLQGRELAWLRVLALALSLKFILSVFENQAYDVIVLLSILVAIDGLVKRKDLQASAGIALAAALKATPLLFFPYLLLRRRGKLFLYCAVLYAGISFLPDLLFTSKDSSLGYYGTWVHDIAGGALLKSPAETQARFWEGVNPMNQSLRSFVYRIAAETGTLSSFSTILPAVIAGYLLVLFGLLHLASKIKYPQVLDGSLLLVGMLMLSPMSSKSHFVVLMLPYMVLSAYVVKERRLRRFGGGILAASFALNTLTSKDMIGKKLSDICLSAGCVTVGTLALLVFLGYLVFFEREKSSSA